MWQRLERKISFLCLFVYLFIYFFFAIRISRFFLLTFFVIRIFFHSHFSIRIFPSASAIRRYPVLVLQTPERFRPFRFVRFSFSRSSLFEPFLSSGFLVLPGTYLMYDPIGKWRHTWQGKLFTFMAHFAYFCLPKRVTIAKVSIYPFCVDLRQNYE